LWLSPHRQADLYARRAAGSSQAVQFERTGYFAADPDDTSEWPVFNRTVGPSDTWAKVQAEGTKGQ
jgi:hypothetical protein